MGVVGQADAVADNRPCVGQCAVVVDVAVDVRAAAAAAALAVHTVLVGQQPLGGGGLVDGQVAGYGGLGVSMVRLVTAFNSIAPLWWL